MSSLVSVGPEHEPGRLIGNRISHMPERFRTIERDGEVDMAWIMARYTRTVVLPEIDGETHKPDVQILKRDLGIRLQEAWTRRSADTEEIISALMQWCAIAESTGIQTLDDFVAELRLYVSPRPFTQILMK